MCVKAEKGIYRAYALNENNEWLATEYPVIERQLFIEDYNLLTTMVTDGPLKSFCYRRLQYLKSKFELHCLLNEVKEWAAIKATPHRDFYNVRKVDTHIHAASSMNQKHLLRFMKKKMKTSGDMRVYKNKEGRIMTLNEVCNELQIQPFDLSVDMLGVHVVSTLSTLLNTTCTFESFRIEILSNALIGSMPNTILWVKVYFGEPPDVIIDLLTHRSLLF